MESKCRVEQLPSEYIKADRCISRSRVSRERCAGGCESQASNTLTMTNAVYQLGNSTCQCCAPKETYIEQVSMDCTTIGNPDVYVIKADYTRITSCDCQVCKG